VVSIDTSGNVVNMKPVEGDPLLVNAAMDAVKQWRYKPYVLNGEPLEVETSVVINFHM